MPNNTSVAFNPLHLTELRRVRITKRDVSDVRAMMPLLGARSEAEAIREMVRRYVRENRRGAA